MTRKYTKEILEEAVRGSTSWAGVLRHLDLQDAGGSRSNIQRNVKHFELDTSHFTGQGHFKGVRSPRKKHHLEYLILRPEGSRRLDTETLRRAMIEYGYIYQCCFDNCPTRNGWINGPIGYEIDHINGTNIDNRPENLRFICAICHTQQPTSSHSWNKAERFGTTSVCECGRQKRYSSKRCIKCYHEHVALHGRPNLRKPKTAPKYSGPEKRRPFPRKAKIEWPDVDILAEMVLESNYTKVAEALGVSDNAVRKRLKTRKVD